MLPYLNVNNNPGMGWSGCHEVYLDDNGLRCHLKSQFPQKCMLV